MKQGIDIKELAAEISRQAETKRDFLADSRKVYMQPDTNNLEVDLTHAGSDLQNVEEFPVTDHAHGQIAAWAKIPKQYYDRMPAELKAVNVNHWLRNEPGNRMIRTLDGECRAFMSDSYRPLDNIDLAQAVLPVLAEQTDMRIESCQITPTRMYIKALFPSIQGDLDPKVGDIVQAGIAIQNSEIGAGSLSVNPFVLKLFCLNGMTTNIGQNRRHVGKRQGEEDNAEEFYRDETKQADDRAFWMKVQDTVRATVTQTSFDRIVQKMIDTKAVDLGDPIAVVESTVKRFNLTEGEGTGILEHLVRGGDLTGFGLLNAVTRYSQDIEDYDRASDFEKIGGSIIELPQSAWHDLGALSEAA